MTNINVLLATDVNDGLYSRPSISVDMNGLVPLAFVN